MIGPKNRQAISKVRGVRILWWYVLVSTLATIVQIQDPNLMPCGPKSYSLGQPWHKLDILVIELNCTIFLSEFK